MPVNHRALELIMDIAGLCDREIADLCGPEIVARLTRETGAAVPILWDGDGSPGRTPRAVHVVAFLGGLHVNAYGRPVFGDAELLPLTDRGMGQRVPWGDPEPGEDGWIDDLWPALLDAVTRAARLVEAHVAGNVCLARIGFDHQAEKDGPVYRRFPYRCQLATHDMAGRHQHRRLIWTGQTAPTGDNSAMACAPVDDLTR